MESETKKFIKEIILMVIVAVIVVGSVHSVLQSMDNEWHKNNDIYLNEQKPLKEISTDLITKGQIRGSFLLVVGSVYGSIDTNRMITLIYGSSTTDETIYRSLTLPIDNVEIVTLNKTNAPYLRIVDYQDSDSELKPKGITITRVRLYLPEGWEILPIGVTEYGENYGKNHTKSR